MQDFDKLYGLAFLFVCGLAAAIYFFVMWWKSEK